MARNAQSSYGQSYMRAFRRHQTMSKTELSVSVTMRRRCVRQEEHLLASPARLPLGHHANSE
ncbi:hypothetical protein BAUCODRAFT_332915 [Baudoinia panamericana UAMH 10762]|uniref:Uncharacterized protein n=1 Tax=Baudoinia panamericana (strain UAMH 10762) TaxID=717646 RepID=M2MXM4_BAUPA|nr:uncharacterized protein BAUCODRAFT_332915 [Baudoinia panamericana UAMH 10762]EMC90990.1 hypothetical protein BAUCODRAFT_332915 [Baudoinia panamericana UAMH 10762]